MGFLESVVSKAKRFFDEGYDELLFFILIFLYLFIGNTTDSRADQPRDQDNNSILFFVVLLLLLLFNGSRDEEEDLDKNIRTEEDIGVKEEMQNNNENTSS